ncbi:Lrp/AsnC family transcriptional regulator [Candidatus Woesearchaeota archaeon]|jgi:DNA-binding Lrp family transcriptional regulator|nr:Lrp/AsnC family transcriptional regulator [Candidatus Woesearchaeota archaeon]MBT6519914.1 Lrp/AsnC family transcriptional regulator [Candidatus Woesearchaeota archaeon]MBT7367110.1 Lrp/AsnC family transcriptional regulator [Candidatus Woesearchaeota archaeon]
MTYILDIDEKDRKLLAQLDADARQSDTLISNKIGVSKQVINYRIQKLINKKIITNFYTIINVGRLGLNSNYVFLQLQKINKEQEQNLIKKLTKLNYVGWLVSGTGRWDLILLTYSKSISEFDELLSEILDLCGEHVHEYSFTNLITSEHIHYKFLKTKNTNKIKQTEKLKLVELNNQDKKIIETISQNARLNAFQISQKTKIPVHTVRYNLKKLIKEQIIEGFKPKINVSKLGFQWHLLLIQFQLTNKKRKNEFINFCKEQDNIYYVTNTIGNYNLMLDIHVKDTKEFKEVLLELKEKFSDVIKTYESIIIFDEYKIDYFPKELIK